tara:strand:+ start:412 stop:729 length:318 start_codon:yes stop_codon:yes gene_type:complete
MKILYKLSIILTLMIILYSCSGLSDAGKVLRNEKTRTTDEFLVKKRDPLILPPDYKKLPEPDTLNKSQKDNTNKIENILKIEKDKNTEKSKTSSIEQSIIEKIGK